MALDCARQSLRKQCEKVRQIRDQRIDFGGLVVEVVRDVTLSCPRGKGDFDGADVVKVQAISQVAAG